MPCLAVLAAFGCCIGFQAAAETVVAGKQGLIGAVVPVLLLKTAMLTPVLAPEAPRTLMIAHLQQDELRSGGGCKAKQPLPCVPSALPDTELQGASSPS